MKTRHGFPKLLDALGCRTGVEIGTYQGDFAAYLLTHWDGHLTVVDPWVRQDGWADLLNHDDQTWTVVEQRAREQLAPFGERVTVVKGTSQTAAVDTGPVDFVYLDARHDRPWIDEDLRLWDAKATRIIAGHDFLHGMRNETLFEVKPAVLEWAKERGYTVETTTHDPYPSWWVVK